MSAIDAMKDAVHTANSPQAKALAFIAAVPAMVQQGIDHAKQGDHEAVATLTADLSAQTSSLLSTMRETPALLKPK